MRNSQDNPAPVAPFAPVLVSACARERIHLHVAYQADAEQNSQVARL